MSVQQQRPLDSDYLPSHVLDELVQTIFQLHPALRPTFLASLGTRVNQTSVRVLFSVLQVQDNDSSLLNPRGTLSAVLSNPTVYAPSVRTLVVSDPEASTLSLGLSSARPISAIHVNALLDLCSNLEEVSWESALPPPDGLCEMFNTRLTRFSYNPSARLSSTSSSTTTNKWDAPSLPLLASSPLTTLTLTCLSRAGANAFADLLRKMGEYSSLEHVDVDFVWLDDGLCERLALAGRRIRTLKLGTSGTKLTDKGIVALMEGCDALEEFVMQDVQGRLSRTLWTKASVYPTGLKSFSVKISEGTSHHSWTADHLLSLHGLPLGSLETLAIVRCEAPPRLENGTITYDMVLDDVVALKAVPSQFVESLGDAKALTKLECDWWSWDFAEVKVLLEHCSTLQTLKICLGTPFSKMLTLTSAFASLPNLLSLSVCVDPTQAPGKPPAPLPSSSNRYKSPPTPSGSPVLRGKSVLPQLFERDEQMMCPSATDPDSDPSMPLMRDVKRFVRKIPKLLLLEWYGKAGRGTWNVTRPISATTSKTSMNVSVDYAAPVISERVWLAMIAGPTSTPTMDERQGQAWITPTGFAMAAAAAKDRDEEQPPSPTRSRKPSNRPTAVNTAFPASRSPVLSPPSFSPLTPPHSETSISSLLNGGVSIASAKVSRRRAPSEASTTGGGGARASGGGRVRAKSSADQGAGYLGNGKATGTAVSNVGTAMTGTSSSASKFSGSGGRGRGNGASASSSSAKDGKKASTGAPGAARGGRGRGKAVPLKL